VLVSDQKTLYWNVVDITTQYLGPAAERFIDRQVQNHLHKDPKKITKSDINSLVDWLRTSVSLLTDNQLLVEEYIKQLQTLRKSSPKTHSTRR
jgi:hypothetical protein